MKRKKYKITFQITLHRSNTAFITSCTCCMQLIHLQYTLHSQLDVVLHFAHMHQQINATLDLKSRFLINRYIRNLNKTIFVRYLMQKHRHRHHHAFLLYMEMFQDTNNLYLSM